MHNQVGFYCGNYQESWNVDHKWSLHLFLKISMKQSMPNSSLVLIDTNGKKARMELNF
jgi:hypothetical protein